MCLKGLDMVWEIYSATLYLVHFASSRLDLPLHSELPSWDRYTMVLETFLKNFGPIFSANTHKKMGKVLL